MEIVQSIISSKSAAGWFSRWPAAVEEKSCHRNAERLSAVLVDHVTDAHGRCHFQEVGRDASVESRQSFRGQDRAEHAAHRQWSSGSASYGLKGNYVVDNSKNAQDPRINKSMPTLTGQCDSHLLPEVSSGRAQTGTMRFDRTSTRPFHSLTVLSRSVCPCLNGSVSTFSSASISKEKVS